MKTIKIIDLLNKIANGEEVPKKILYKYQNKDFYEEYRLKWNKKYEAYYTTKDNTPITHLLADNLWNLNDEVQILEDTPKEDKKIEKLENLNTDYHMERRKYGALTNEEIVLDIQTLKNYINKLIDKENSDNNE